jgi:DNA repair protein SbcC/Rad50
MKINNLTISNFKNYDGEISFDLSKQITILYGNNGFGKSTFFDAIEWCFTNKIDRFDGTEAEIKRDIINRNCNLDNFQVSVCIEFGGNNLTRSFNVINGEIGNTQVKLIEKSGQLYRGQENIEERLKSQYFNDINFARGAYGQLIKKTYILSQDQVTDFVTSEDSEERYRALANIMGLKSMINESDNAKNILSALKIEDRKYENQLKQFDESIKSKEEAKHVVDIYEINAKFYELGFDNLEDNIEARCKGLQSNMIEEKNRNESFIKFYRKLELDKIKSINNIKSQIIYNQNWLTELETKENKSKELLKKVEEHIEGLENEKNNLSKYNVIRARIREHENILFELDLKENNFEEINRRLNLLRENASKIEYQISIRQTLSLNEYKLKEIGIENEELDNKKNQIINRKAKYQEIKKRLDSCINDNKNKLLFNLITNIRDIQVYVKTNNLNRCPVCSSVPEDKLDNCIEHNIDFLNTKIEEDTKYLERLMNLKKKLENRVQVFSEDLNRLLSRVKNNDLLLQRLSEESNNYKTNSLYDKYFESYSEEELKENLYDIRDKINIHQKGAESLLVLKGLYENLRDIEKRDVEKKQNIHRERKEANVNNSLDRFIRAKNRISNYINRNSKLIKDINLATQELNLVDIRIREFINVNQYNQNLNEIFLKAQDNVKDLESKINILSNLNEMLLALKMNSDIENQIKTISENRSKLALKKNELINVIGALEENINHRTNEFGNEVKDFLNTINSPIQRYFRYLNPIPSNSHLLFDGEDENLNIKVIFEKNSKDKFVSNAKNVLSSGQLNVLAISVFLAINEGQKTHTLDFVAIDDPIQNMDDVNQYSICDILSYIKKQLIISTHDIEFLKLFIKKNEHKKDDIQVYSFMSPYINNEKVQHIQFSESSSY